MADGQRLRIRRWRHNKILPVNSAGGGFQLRALWILASGWSLPAARPGPQHTFSAVLSQRHSVPDRSGRSIVHNLRHRLGICAIRLPGSNIPVLRLLQHLRKLPQGSNSSTLMLTCKSASPSNHTIQSPLWMMPQRQHAAPCAPRVNGSSIGHARTSRARFAQVLSSELDINRF